jgi:hypothetical protein
MRTLTLIRQPSIEQGTLGEFFEGEEHICYTCERPWKDNEHGVSCIPIGSYIAKRVSLQEHPHIRRIIQSATITTAFLLQDVPNRDGIFIHPGNVMTDSEGCILVGLYIGKNIKNGLPGVTSSQNTFNSFMARYDGEDELEVIIK